MMKEFLEAGKLVTTHGVRGELKAEVWCDDFEFFSEFEGFYLDPQGKTWVEAERIRPQGRMALITLEGVDTMDKARALVGKTLYFSRDEVELEEGCHYIADIIGCQVVDADTGKVYGKVTDIYQGAQDIYTVKGEDGKACYFPGVPQFLKEIDPQEGKVLVTPIPGMFEDAVNGDKE